MSAMSEAEAKEAAKFVQAGLNFEATKTAGTPSLKDSKVENDKIKSPSAMAAELTAEMYKSFFSHAVTQDIHKDVMAAVRMGMCHIPLGYKRKQVQRYVDNLARAGFTFPALVTTESRLAKANGRYFPIENSRKDVTVLVLL